MADRACDHTIAGNTVLGGYASSDAGGSRPLSPAAA
jgi:hypothetical protein